MNDQTGSAKAQRNRARPAIAGWRIARIAGIDIFLNISLVIVFALIVTALGANAFPAWHPDWNPVTSWLTAFAAATVFFISIVLHELSHALVGRHYGAKVTGITLFVFGGIAQMEREPHGWRAELLMALAGPAMSILIGIVCLFLASFGTDMPTIDESDPASVYASLGPLTTLLAWVGSVNIIIALFNLVPGFPLDGGRVLRAALWGMTGDLHKATRWASRLGQAFALLLILTGMLMVFGVRVPFFGSGVIGGLWIAFIGWFLNSAALVSYRQLIVRDALEDIPVARLFDREVATVPAGMAVDEFVHDRLLHDAQRCFPVVEKGRLSGLVCLSDVRKVEREAWGSTPVAEIMTPRGDLVTAELDMDAMEVMELLSQHGVDQLPVMDGDSFEGLVRREGILRWLALQGDRAEAGVGRGMLAAEGARQQQRR